MLSNVEFIKVLCLSIYGAQIESSAPLHPPHALGQSLPFNNAS